MFRLTYLKSRPFLIYTLSPVYRKRSTTGVTSGAGTVYLSGAHEFTPVVVGFLFAELVFFNMQLSVQCFIDSCFLLVLFVIALSILRFTASDYLCGICKLFMKNSLWLQSWSLFPILSFAHCRISCSRRHCAVRF